MNSTIRKFGYPASLVREFDHWLVLLRPAQVTLGSLVLAAKSDSTAYGELPREAFVEQGTVIAVIERSLRAFVDYEKINYLMLMMVDPHVHYHGIPRYSQSRPWNGVDFPDSGWPAAPQLASAVQLSTELIHELAEELRANFR